MEARNTEIAERESRQEQAELVYSRTDGQEVRKNVLRTTTLIGAHASSNLQLLSSQVSDSHCLLTLDGRGFRVWDLRSRTGTFVNDKKIQCCRLKNGDQLRVGSFRFEFRTNVEDHSRQGFFIDDYRVLGILGTGGMGWLYVVDDPRTLQRFALKVLMRRADHPGVSQEELQTRFLLEARAGGRLKHPHIVEVLEYQHRIDVEYLLLELFESISLQELVQRDGPLDVGLVCSIGQQAALALQHIHAVGSVHRDVKPSNILVNNEGLAKVCDFGLVFLGDDPIENELAEQLGNDCLGTADYIAPEQSYHSYSVDGRADIYSLGCALYTALASRLPFPHEKGKEKIFAHRHKTPVPLEHYNADVGPEVLAIISRCMEKDPDRRFQSAGELAQALSPHAVSRKVTFEFADLLAQRTQQASFRLSDPRKKHFLQRIPANVATSLQLTGSNERLEEEHLVIEAPLRSEIPTHLPGDTSAATEPR